jgi:hypothetical protein
MKLLDLSLAVLGLSGVFGAARFYLEAQITKQIDPSAIGPKFNYWEQRKSSQKNWGDLLRAHEQLFPASRIRKAARVLKQVQFVFLTGTLLILIGYWASASGNSASHPVTVSSTPK